MTGTSWLGATLNQQIAEERRCSKAKRDSCSGENVCSYEGPVLCRFVNQNRPSEQYPVYHMKGLVSQAHSDFEREPIECLNYQLQV